MKNFGNWFKVIGIAVAAGAATNAGSYLQSGEFDPRKLGGAAAGGALLAIVGLFIRPPGSQPVGPPPAQPKP